VRVQLLSSTKRRRLCPPHALLLKLTMPSWLIWRSSARIAFNGNTRRDGKAAAFASECGMPGSSASAPAYKTMRICDRAHHCPLAIRLVRYTGRRLSLNVEWRTRLIIGSVANYNGQNYMACSLTKHLLTLWHVGQRFLHLLEQNARHRTSAEGDLVNAVPSESPAAQFA
jgi:hypothetical protein